MIVPIGIVAGSGITLTSLFDEINETRPFSDFTGLSSTTVEGHSSQFTIGTCGSCPVVLQSGRLHIYEGLSVQELTRTVDVMKNFGVQTLLLTNAVGGLHPKMTPGTLVAVNQFRLWPYRNWSEACAFPQCQISLETLLPDYVPTYCDFTGVYQWMHGPSYETRAEIKALQRMGADVVGMSAAPEIVRCKQLGIRTGVISCITNACCEPHPLTHEEVIAVAHATSTRLMEIIRRLLPEIVSQEVPKYYQS